MEKTPAGTSVGVDDPYAFAGRCDHLTSDGHCRYARERADRDPAFAAEREADGFECPAADPHGDRDWRDCPHYRSRSTARECARCGLEEHRDAHSTERPLLEEHHLSYRDAASLSHEVTVHLCRWCHAKVHGSWARVSDDVNPDPEALAAREARRSRERAELSFESAAERYRDDG